MIDIRIQHEDFDNQDCFDALRENSNTGAIVSFTGLVREFDEGCGTGLLIEHYPEMTEQALRNIADQACQRWSILNIVIIHRIGSLSINDQIVYVGISSEHRKDAFSSCEFIMDYLKNDAPFWKKALNKQGDYWVEAKESDQLAKARWQK